MISHYASRMYPDIKLSIRYGRAVGWSAWPNVRYKADNFWGEVYQWNDTEVICKWSIKIKRR